LQERIAMIARYAPIGRGWGWLAAGLLITPLATGLTDAAHPTPASGSLVETTTKAEQDGVEPKPAAKPVPKPIADAIAVLRKTEIGRPNQWAPAIRTLAQIGKPAVPYLIEELDRTTEDQALSSLAFALRAIGDPRAVPALIRAIPRTLVENHGDFGLSVFNLALLAFMQQHDTYPGMQAWIFAFGTPYHEVIGSLHALTGHRFNEELELHLALQGSAKQRWLKLRLMHGLAAQWAVWWKKNWQRFTDDPAYGKISLPRLPEAPRVAVAPVDQPFPTGNRVQVSSGPINEILGPPPPFWVYYRTFMDLDTGRQMTWPQGLPDSLKVKADEVAAFAAREGLDLRGIEYTPPGSGRSHYAIQGLGLRAWQIDNSAYWTIEEELRAGRPPKLDRPAGELLMDLDPKTGAYHPENKATFLFITREGTTGALQLNGIVTALPGPEDARMRFRPPDPPEEPGKPSRLPLVHGAYRGVQFTYKFLYTDDDGVR
jgi:hypothetical protein